MKRTEITIDTRRTMVIRRRPILILGWCEECMAEVRMIRPDEAARLINVSSRLIYQWMEEGKVHFTDDPSELLVCADSLNRLRALEV
jgi:hypothetical protein